jgi:DEAD/DEAH box helicase domain-containing protein
VIAYQRKSISGGDTLETVPLDLPETTFDTEAVWFMPTARQLDGLEEMPKLLSSLHAAEHSLIALLPLWAMCDRWDIGGLSTNAHPQTGRPTIFIYDGHPGGVGITERGFERFEGWVEDTAKMLAGCPCEHGCPSCVQSPKCGNLNDFLDKDGALTLLRRLLASAQVAYGIHLDVRKVSVERLSSNLDRNAIAGGCSQRRFPAFSCGDRRTVEELGGDFPANQLVERASA